jgi:hypothetical protein
MFLYCSWCLLKRSTHTKSLVLYSACFSSGCRTNLAAIKKSWVAFVIDQCPYVLTGTTKFFLKYFCIVLTPASLLQSIHENPSVLESAVFDTRKAAGTEGSDTTCSCDAISGVFVKAAPEAENILSDRKNARFSAACSEVIPGAGARRPARSKCASKRRMPLCCKTTSTGERRALNTRTISGQDLNAAYAQKPLNKQGNQKHQTLFLTCVTPSMSMRPLCIFGTSLFAAQAKEAPAP